MWSRTRWPPDPGETWVAWVGGHTSCGVWGQVTRTSSGGITPHTLSHTDAPREARAFPEAPQGPGGSLVERWEGKFTSPELRDTWGQGTQQEGTRGRRVSLGGNRTNSSAETPEARWPPGPQSGQPGFWGCQGLAGQQGQRVGLGAPPGTLCMRVRLNTGWRSRVLELLRRDQPPRLRGGHGPA